MSDARHALTVRNQVWLHNGLVITRIERVIASTAHGQPQGSG